MKEKELRKSLMAKSKEELDLEALKAWADLCKGKAGSGIKGKCCFCGKEIEGYGNDPRPIKVACEKMPRCCDDCNKKFVIPTRASVWGKENELRMALKLACEELMQDLKFESKDDKHYTLCENIEYFKIMARKELKNEEC